MLRAELPERLDSLLQEAAAHAGLSQEAPAAELLATHPEGDSLPLSAFSDNQLIRLKSAIERGDRGETASNAQVDLFFEDWFSALEKRRQVEAR
jgi:hypothetical protein